MCKYFRQDTKALGSDLAYRVGTLGIIVESGTEANHTQITDHNMTITALL